MCFSSENEHPVPSAQTDAELQGATLWHRKHGKGDSEEQISVNSRTANRLPHAMHHVTRQALMQLSSQDVCILTETSLSLLEVSPEI